MLKHLSIKEKKALEEFKKTLLREFGREILELRIFGSKARGDFKKTLNIGEMSDTDVFVILKKTSLKKEDLIFKITTDVLLKYGVDISIKIFSEKEYREKLNLQVPFFLIIQKEGVSL